MLLVDTFLPISILPIYTNIPTYKKKKKKKKKKKISIYTIMSFSSISKKDVKHQSINGKYKSHYNIGRRTPPITDYYYGMGGSNPIPFRPLPGLIP